MQVIRTIGMMTDVIVSRGDSFVAQLQLTKDGQPYTPDEGETVAFTVTRDGAEVIAKDVPTDGLVVELTPAETQAMRGTYMYAATLTTATGDRDTFIRGRLRLI